MPFDLAVIDLDNTLYAADCGVFARMDKRMTAFVAKELGVDENEANRLRIKYWKEYGTTLRGMMLHHGMDAEPFLHDVHNINAHEILQKDEALNHALSRLPGRKVIHTNGIIEHAERILETLEVLHHFERIYDIRFNDYLPKPNKETLAMLIETEGATPERTIVVDDMLDNLAVATELGCKTVWINHNIDAQTKKGTWDYHVSAFHSLPKKIRKSKSLPTEPIYTKGHL